MLVTKTVIQPMRVMLDGELEDVMRVVIRLIQAEVEDEVVEDEDDEDEVVDEPLHEAEQLLHHEELQQYQVPVVIVGMVLSSDRIEMGSMKHVIRRHLGALTVPSLPLILAQLCREISPSQHQEVLQ